MLPCLPALGLVTFWVALAENHRLPNQKSQQHKLEGENRLEHAAHYALNDRDACCEMGWKVQGEFRGPWRMKRQVYILVNGGLVQDPSKHTHTHTETAWEGIMKNTERRSGTWTSPSWFDLYSWTKLIMLSLKVKYKIPSGCLADKYWFWQLGQTKEFLRWGIWCAVSLSRPK